MTWVSRSEILAITKPGWPLVTASDGIKFGHDRPSPVYLRIDSIEHAIRSSNGPTYEVSDVGYRVGYAMARDTKTFEGGADERCVVIEFPSIEQAVAAYESVEYQAVIATMRNLVTRQLRIVAGVN